MPKRERLNVRLDSALLAELRELSEREGRPLQALVEVAVARLIAARRNGRARPHVMAAYRKSRGHYAALYDKLAK